MLFSSGVGGEKITPEKQTRMKSGSFVGAPGQIQAIRNMSGATVIRQVLTFHKLSAGDGANKSATPLQLAHAPDDGTTANQSPRRPGNPAERWSALEQRLVPSRAPPFYRTSSHPTRLVGLFACSLPLLRTTQHSCRQGSHSPVGHALHTPTSLPSHNSTEKKREKKLCTCQMRFVHPVHTWELC